MKRLLAIVLTLTAVAYPFLVFYGLNHGYVQFVALIMIVVFALRALLSKQGGSEGLARYAMPTAIAGSLLALVAAVANAGVVLKFYPLMMSLTMAFAFWASLSAPQNIIEGFARRFDKDFSDEAVPYTRKVTWAWIVFFIVNTLISLATMLFASDFGWSLYNGFISYMLMGLMFAGEFLIRTFIVKPRHAVEH